MLDWIKNKFTKQKDLAWPDYLDKYKYTNDKQREFQSSYYIVPEETFTNLINSLNNATCRLIYKFKDFNLEFAIKIEGFSANFEFPIAIQNLKINKDYKLSEANKLIISGYIENVISVVIGKSSLHGEVRFEDFGSKLHPCSIQQMYNVKKKLYEKAIKLIEDYIDNNEEFCKIIENAKEDYIKKVLILINRYGLKQKDFANYELLR